mmetsp:Transcript_21629/g.26784  ORF Transcript_21629/g.26784 Transcript_21629/m.26784 type:complete len:437 (-) Transcript_21629:428-1738(-)|eukprot:CAMPEP_0172509066 /NCGR_PEP_ID=MMETSP1066-20121228/217312_1 /TAXON_ID=671091 /ORGANISM="Coscinodiscus wailesii, Strain CCMP2513" /LENGTH=436 /DNA_ID=CAMNT_0013287381 /DNA_START=61 /DNA_END=1371 /DNA_ORIENTATION=+
MGQQRRPSECSLRSEGGRNGTTDDEHDTYTTSPLTPATTSSQTASILADEQMTTNECMSDKAAENIQTINNGFQHSLLEQSQYMPYQSSTYNVNTNTANVPVAQIPSGIINSVTSPQTILSDEVLMKALLMKQQALAHNTAILGSNHPQLVNTLFGNAGAVNGQPHLGLYGQSGFPQNNFNQIPSQLLFANLNPSYQAHQAGPILTIQDRPMIPPVYNGVNPHYPGLRIINSTPPVFVVDDFLTPQECNFLIQAAEGCYTPAPVVGPGAGEVSSSRTSSTCYLAREDLPVYMQKVSALTGKPVVHCELPQVGRYLPTQQYLQHFDAFDLSNENGVRFASNGGQRTVTVLVYLNDVARGGQTAFPTLNLKVQPKRGMALVFFPASIDGLLDKMALHAALPAEDIKFVSQVWIRQSNYEGQPSKRLEKVMDYSVNISN